MYEQQIYYFMSGDNMQNTLYYLVNHQEKRYCIIPKKYHKLAQYLYGLHLNCVGKTIEDIVNGYDLRTLDNFGECDI